MSEGRPVRNTVRIKVAPRGEARAACPASEGNTESCASGRQERTAAGISDPQMYQHLLQSIYDGLMITGADGRVIDFNERARGLFAWQDGDLVGTDVISLLSGAEPDLLATILDDTETSVYAVIESDCIRRDSSTFPAEIAVSRISLEGGPHLCFMFRDISVRKQAQTALEQAIDRLEAHDRDRAQFVESVSHELRTPLTSMMYAVSNMLRGAVGPVPDKACDYLTMMVGDCKRLLGTVNDILDLKKMENGTLDLKKHNLPVMRIISKAVETMRPQAEEKSIDMALTEGGGRWFVASDAYKIERVILNIVRNAIQFTPSGGAVGLSVTDDPDRAGYISLQVRDTGEGIPADAVDRVTDRYFTVDEQPRGSGLGLSLASEMVENHGGSLRVQSPVPGQEGGTLVTVSLPCSVAPSVMVVGDSDDQGLMAGQLEAQGYNVQSIVDVEHVLNLSSDDMPDLILLHLALQGEEGCEIIHQLKRNEGLNRIPIIVVTGADISRSNAELLRSFSISALGKPWEEMDLLGYVDGAIIGSAELEN